MNIFNLFKRGGSAPVARDRLQFCLHTSAPPRDLPICLPSCAKKFSLL